MSLKILHITDIHDGHPKNDGMFVHALDELETFSRLSGDDTAILVITGDIIDFPDRKRLHRASDLLRKFQKRTNIPVVVVPGNHDMEENRLRRGFMQTPGGWKAQKDAFAKAFEWTVRPSGSATLETMHPPMSTVPGVYYRVDRAIDEKGRVLFLVGLDTVAEDAFFAEGRLGEEQISRLRQDLSGLARERPDSRIFLHMHHSPVDTSFAMSLSDAAPLSDAIRDSGARVDGLLFGHTHNGRVYEGAPFRGAASPLDIPVALDGGCLNPAVSPLAKWFDGPYFHAFRVLDPWEFPTFARLAS
jgi:DNA repair exonuclease SbcCD nuclease subunit